MRDRRPRPCADFVYRDSDRVWFGDDARTPDLTVEGPTQFRIGFLQFPDRAETYPEAHCRVRVKRWKRA